MPLIRPIDLTVVSGATVTIIIPTIFVDNGRAFDMRFALTDAEWQKFKLAQGNEIVSIQVGASGTTYPLLTGLGNRFYSDRLRLGFVYRIVYGNDGAPGGVQHFINRNTPKCAFGFNAGNAGANANPAPSEDEAPAS